jgi:glycosyltransferase involved in cell wall biosynthesis
MQPDYAVECGGKRLSAPSNPDCPLFTVVTVIFNGEKELESTILSVLNQSYSNVEYIIVDGRSTDGTLDILRKYEDSIDYWVSEPDRGIYDAMNKGIRHARGEWLYFLNCGDCFADSEVLAKVALPAARTDVPLVIGRVNYLCGDRVLKQFPVTVPTEITARALFRSKFCHQAFFARRRSYIDAGGFDTRFPVFSDFHTAYRIIRDGGGFDRINLTIADFDGSGVSSDPRHALQLYCEAERVLTCLGESRGPVSFGLGYLRALAYQLRKWLAANLV